MPKRPVSMEDVARHVGLSRSTVSFVLNDRTDIQIPPESRRRVLDAAHVLGYRPNAAARALALGRSDLLGVITDISASPFAGDIISGAQESAWQRGKMLLIVAEPADAAVDRRVVETLLERRVEGLIYATHTHREVRLPDIASEVPVVLVHCFDTRGVVPSVVPDEAEGGYVATHRLLAAGHERIAMINLDPDLLAASGRQAGYERALAERGIEADPRLVVCGHGTAAGGYDRARELLDLKDPPTGLFCGNDRVAMGAYDAIKAHGLQVGRDVGVVGFDNQQIIAAYLRPALTTVALPFQAMGHAAICMLGEIAEGRAPRPRVITCPIIERASV